MKKMILLSVLIGTSLVSNAQSDTLKPKNRLGLSVSTQLIDFSSSISHTYFSLSNNSNFGVLHQNKKGNQHHYYFQRLSFYNQTDGDYHTNFAVGYNYRKFIFRNKTNWKLKPYLTFDATYAYESLRNTNPLFIAGIMDTKRNTLEAHSLNTSFGIGALYNISKHFFVGAETNIIRISFSLSDTYVLYHDGSDYRNSGFFYHTSNPNIMFKAGCFFK